jgi:hypothetical protein
MMGDTLVVRGGSPAKVAELLKAIKQGNFSNLVFEGGHSDNRIVNATIDLFRHLFRQGRHVCLMTILNNDGDGQTAVILQAAMALESVSEISLHGGVNYYGDSPTPVLPVILAISTGMKYNCHLKTVRLSYIDLSSDHAAALGDGLSVSQHLECLDMEYLSFLAAMNQLY